MLSAWLIVALLAAGFGLGAWLGAPYLPILGRDTTALLDLSQLKPGQLLIDLGSGDGRLLKAAARRGIKGLGYEINPILYLISIINCWPQRSLIKLKLANYWTVRLPTADAIYVFLIDRYMDKLDRKLTTEVEQPTRVVSYVFTLPNRQPIHQTKNAYVYLYPESSRLSERV